MLDFLFGDKVVRTTTIKEKTVQVSKRMYVDVTRVEVIHNGRAYTNYNAREVEVQLQDDGKTLKIFLK